MRNPILATPIFPLTMKVVSNRILSALLVGFVSPFLILTAYATGQARADFQNLSSEQSTAQLQNPGVAFYGSYFNNTDDPQNGSVVIEEATFGQAFSQWFPSGAYGSGIVAEVNDVLYPNTDDINTRTGIETSGKPFRYKWLLYEGTGTDVTAFDVTDLGDWFTQADRDAIRVQIAAMKKAVAASPLDTGLRTQLLDLYYDFAVAEMQIVKPLLAKLARFHLGLETLPSGKFIIDEEIETFEEIVAGFDQALEQYRDLIGIPFPGIDPSNFDSNEPFGTPMGRYVFIKEQRRRNTEPAEYANEEGVLEVPQPDLTGEGPPSTPGILFNGGYKDLNALLQIMGQRKQHLASLARLRGIRKAPGDLAIARQYLDQAAGSDDTDLQLIKGWFPELFPPDLNALSQEEREALTTIQTNSGVLASLATIDAGRIDLMETSAFLNGSHNLLGFDPEFLLLVQDQTGQVPPKESFDTLREMLKGPNQPLTVALEKLGTELPPTGAIGLYLNFQQKVDKVADDIDDLDDALDDRFFAITGFEPNAEPGFTLTNPNPTTGSELGGVLATIENLKVRQLARDSAFQELNSQLAESADGVKGAAVAALESALNKEQALLLAGEKYKATTRPLYDEMIGASVKSATAQAAFDTVAATAGAIDYSAPWSAVGAAVTAAAGTINTIIQADTTETIGRKEQAIDYAGIDFTVTTETVDAALVVNQARQELSSLKREQVATNLESLSDIAALQQAVAQKNGLLTELARIVTKRDENVAEIRKRSYADPLHYHRAERALVDADEAFVTAQRWMFYTLQALNYKWHGKFSITEESKTYDTSTVFKCRNAKELDDLLTQMTRWNDIRVTQTTDSPRIITRISLLEHVFARNPRRHDLVDPSDPGTRMDDTIKPKPSILPLIPTLHYFRKLLSAKYTDSSGNLVIPFSTAFRNQTVDRVDGNFFRGASYDEDGNVTDPGFWREKIEYVKVNIIAENAPEIPSNIAGGLTYGGTTYFHTRVPPRSDRSIAGLAVDDAPGELLVAPFRYWVSPDFSLNFVPQSKHLVSIPVAYNRNSAIVQGENGIQDNLGTSFQVNAFAGRSIAASGWNLTIERIQSEGFIVDPANINDIEIIIAYKHSDRIAPPN